MIKRCGSWLLGLVLLLAAIWFALVLGNYPISWQVVLQAIFNPGKLVAESGNNYSSAYAVIWQIRMPRIFAAVMVGACLAGSGAAYQSMFRNPLVSPDILGVSAGAGLGAVLGIVLNQSLFTVQILAFVFGLASVSIVYMVSLAIKRHDQVLVLVLSGVAVGAFITAFISLITVLSDPYGQLASITFWLMGGLGSVSMSELKLALPFALIGLLPLFLLRWRVDLLSLPDDEARALGLNTHNLRRLLIIASTLTAASVVSFAGIVAWVGLLVPHLARLLVGPVFSRLLPASLVLGAVFLLITDTLSRSIAGIEIPIGVLTSLLGVPFFMVLLVYGRRSV